MHPTKCPNCFAHKSDQTLAILGTYSLRLLRLQLPSNTGSRPDSLHDSESPTLVDFGRAVGQAALPSRSPSILPRWSASSLRFPRSLDCACYRGVPSYRRCLLCSIHPDTMSTLWRQRSATAATWLGSVCAAVIRRQCSGTPPDAADRAAKAASDGFCSSSFASWSSLQRKRLSKAMNRFRDHCPPVRKCHLQLSNEFAFTYAVSPNFYHVQQRGTQ